MKAWFAIGLVLLGLMVGCGGGGGSTQGEAETRGGTETTATPPSTGVTAELLGPSIEGATAGFVARDGTTLAHSLERLGDGTTAKVVAGSGQCRSAGQTPAIDSAGRYPFACIVGIVATPPGGGSSLEVTLGFVVLSVKGDCWKASNERIAAGTTTPQLIPRRQALAKANLLEGCV